MCTRSPTAAILLTVACFFGASRGHAATLDSVDVFVTDAVNAAVFAVDLSTGELNLVSIAGDIRNPSSIDLEPSGQLVITEANLDYVIRIDPATGNQTVLCEQVIQFCISPVPNNPQGIAVGASGNIFVATSSTSPSITRIDPLTGAHERLASFGLLSPGIGVDSGGDLFVPSGRSIQRVDPVTGEQTTVSALGKLIAPRDIAVLPNGDLLVINGKGLGADEPDSLIQIDPATGEQTVVWESPLTGLASLRRISTDPDGVALVLGARDFFQSVLIRFDPETRLHRIVWEESETEPVSFTDLATISAPEPASALFQVTALISISALSLARRRCRDVWLAV